MRKTFYALIASNAQLLVDENGHVAVGIDTESTLSSVLNVNTTGSAVTKGEFRKEYISTNWSFI